MTGTPSDREDEYFKRQELEQLKRAREEAARALAEQERKRLKELHWMRCPKCGLELAEVDYRGVVVDACFNCGGTFFDRGEVEKILDAKEPGTMRRMISHLFG